MAAQPCPTAAPCRWAQTATARASPLQCTAWLTARAAGCWGAAGAPRAPAAKSGEGAARRNLRISLHAIAERWHAMNELGGRRPARGEVGRPAGTPGWRAALRPGASAPAGSWQGQGALVSMASGYSCGHFRNPRHLLMARTRSMRSVPVQCGDRQVTAQQQPLPPPVQVAVVRGAIKVAAQRRHDVQQAQRSGRLEELGLRVCAGL